MQPARKTLPFLGAMNLEILQASQTSLHGDLYFDLMVRETGDMDAEPFQLRVAHGACGVPPAPGARVKVNFLAGQVESLQPVM